MRGRQRQWALPLPGSPYPQHTHTYTHTHTHTRTHARTEPAGRRPTQAHLGLHWPLVAKHSLCPSKLVAGNRPELWAVSAHVGPAALSVGSALLP